MLLQVILEGLGLGALLVLVCAIGIRKGAVGMVHFYSDKVQQRCIELRLTTKERIRRKAIVLKNCLPADLYSVCVAMRVYAQWRKWIFNCILAVLCDPVRDEPHRPAWH